MTLRTSPRFASGWERVGPTRSANHPPTGAKLLRRDAPSAGRSADSLERVLLPGNLYWWRGASFDSSWSGGIFRFCSSLKGKEKGRTLTIQWRFVGCDPLLMPGFSVLRGGFCALRISIIPAGYLVFGLLAGGFIIAALLIISGIVWDAGERLRGVVRAGCGRRFGGASGDGLGGCIS